MGRRLRKKLLKQEQRRERKKQRKEVSQRVEQLVEQTSRERGQRSEQRALEALCLEPIHWWVEDFKPTNRRDQLDRRGVDMIVETKYGLVYLQIKASQAGARQHEKERRKLKEHFPKMVLEDIVCVVVPPDEDKAIVRKKLLRAISEEIDYRYQSSSRSIRSA